MAEPAAGWWGLLHGERDALLCAFFPDLDRLTIALAHDADSSKVVGAGESSWWCKVP